MLFSTLSTVLMAAAALTSSASAFPTSWPGYGPPKSTGLTVLASKMPKNTLPAPTGLQLKYVMLGLGTQNYTCTPGNDTAEPGTTGALAQLYDIGTRLNNDWQAAFKIGTISGLALNLKNHPRELAWYLASQGYQQILGEHFFTLTTPTFSLDKVQSNPFPRAYVAKKAEMDAPKNACPGTQNEGAVKWLQLIDDKGISQGGVNTVYRLETAGGNKPAQCKGMKATFEVPYAAQYWIYGPA